MAKKILIVDDEKIARDRIRRFLQSFSEPLEVFEAENGMSALEQIKTVKPDVVLLDIQMPVMSGFDVLYQIENRNFQLIFQTAYDEFAVKAFEVNACDYLLKPFTEERLMLSLKKAFNLQEQQSKITGLEKHLENSNIYLKTIISKSGATTKILKIDEIHYFKSEDHYTFAVTNDSEFILDNSLNWLEERLDPTLFIRCHRSSIVQISSIEKIGNTENSTITLINRVVVPLSRENRKKVLEIFVNIKGRS